MFVTKSRTGIALFTFLSQIHLFDATLTIGKSSAEIKTGDSFSITCLASDLSEAVVFYKGTIEIGRCAKSVFAGFPGLCAAGFSQDITTNITTYSIGSANATFDDGQWTCQHTPETSNTLTITVYGFPTNPVDDNQAYLPNSIDTTVMDSTQFTVNVSECVNPSPTISWSFYEDCDGTSITPIPITSTTSEDQEVVCNSPYSAYKSIVTVTDMKNKVNGDYCYKVRVLVGYPGTSFTDVTLNFTQDLTFILLLFIEAVIALGKILQIFAPSILGVHSGLTGILHLKRYLKRKSLKHAKCIYLHIGDQVKVNCSYPFKNITSNSNIVIKYENGQLSFNIQAVTETHYGVHKFEIPIEHTGMLKDLVFEHEEVKMDPLKMAPLPVTDKEIRMEFHFEVNHEEIHSIREPRRYIFAEEYNLRGVTFISIQIICVAVIYQLVSLITSAGVLLALYYGYGKYDTKVVIPVSFAIAVLFAFVGTIVYVLTVICCRKQKDKKDKDNVDEDQTQKKKDKKNKENVNEDQTRCCKTILLFVMIIFPVAWLLMIVMWIVNICRQFPDERNQNNTVEMKPREKKGSTNTIMPEKHDGDFLKNVPKDRRLPPITKSHDTDETNETGNAGIKKQSKKERKERQKSILQGNDPLEPAKHSEKRETGSNIEQVNSNASHIDDVKF